MTLFEAAIQKFPLYIELRDLNKKPVYRIAMSACGITFASHGKMELDIPELAVDENFTLTSVSIVAKIGPNFATVMDVGYSGVRCLHKSDMLHINPVIITTT